MCSEMCIENGETVRICMAFSANKLHSCSSIHVSGVHVQRTLSLARLLNLARRITSPRILLQRLFNLGDLQLQFQNMDPRVRDLYKRFILVS
jgi:hypothetical protein